MSEIWTAKEKTEIDGKPMLIFEVTDEATGQTRQERRYMEAIPLMFVLGGYPEAVGRLMQTWDLPWRFRKTGDQIYIDGPSIEVPDYHPIDKSA